MIQRIRNNWSWLIAGFITLIFLIVFMLVKSIIPFGDNTLSVGDCFHQYIPFLSEFRNKLLSSESLNYSWNIGLGSNFMSIYSYYLTSPFNLFVLLFDKSDIFSVVSITICIRIVFMAIFFGYFLHKRFETNNLFITLFSVAYSLSSYICGYYWNIMWLDCIMILPLIILGMDRLMKEQKIFLYILALFYSMFCNYYFSFMICIFLLLYFFTYDFEDIKDFFSKGIRFAGASILAAGMSAFTIVVSYFDLMYQSSDLTEVPENQWFTNFANIIRNQYFLDIPSKVDERQFSANIYVGVVTVILLIFYPFVKSIKPSERIRKFVLAIFMLVSMNQSILNYIWHGFHVQRMIPNRFALIYVFFILTLAYETAVELKGAFLKRYIIPGAIAVCLPLSIYVFTDFEGIISSKGILILSTVITFLYVLIIGLYSVKEKYSKVLIPIFSVFVILEVCINFWFTFTDYMPISSDMDIFDRRERSIEASIDYEKASEGNSLYREEITYNTLMRNENTYHNISGISEFSSTVDYNLMYTMYYLGLYSNYSMINYYYRSPVSPIIDDLFGIKYINSLVNDRYEENYKLIYENKEDGIYTYCNEDALPIGYGVSKNTLKTVFNTEDCASNQGKLLSDMSDMDIAYLNVVTDMEINSKTCAVSYNPENGFFSLSNSNNITEGKLDASLHFTCPYDGQFYYTVRTGYIDNLEVLVNNKVVVSNGTGAELLRIGTLKEGDEVDIKILFKLFEGEMLDIPAYISSFDQDLEIESIKKLAENGLNISEYESDSIKGDFTLEKNQIMFMTIPYDDCWKIKLDGAEVKPIKVLNTFLGVDIQEGNHTIEMKYIPRGKNYGIIISCISWVIFIMLCIIEHRKKVI